MVRALRFAALSAALFVTPAVAQQSSPTERTEQYGLAQLQDPATADAIASVAEALARSLLAMPVGQLANSVRRLDPNSRRADLPSDTTLGTLVGADDGDAERLGDDAHAAGTMAAGLSRQMAVMLPMLSAMARDMAAQWDAARDAAGRESRRR